MNAQQRTAGLTVGIMPRVRLLASFLAIALAFQWTAAAGPVEISQTLEKLAGGARLEPTEPSRPYLAPRDDARGILSEQRAKPAEKTSVDDQAATRLAASLPPDRVTLATPVGPARWLRSLQSARAYDPRGPPLRG